MFFEVHAVPKVARLAAACDRHVMGARWRAFGGHLGNGQSTTLSSEVWQEFAALGAGVAEQGPCGRRPGSPGFVSWIEEARIPGRGGTLHLF